MGNSWKNFIHNTQEYEVGERTELNSSVRAGQSVAYKFLYYWVMPVPYGIRAWPLLGTLWGIRCHEGRCIHRCLSVWMGSGNPILGDNKKHARGTNTEKYGWRTTIFMILKRHRSIGKSIERDRMYCWWKTFYLRDLEQDSANLGGKGYHIMDYTEIMWVTMW